MNNSFSTRSFIVAALLAASACGATAADKIRRALDDYPRNDDGGFWHSWSLNGQMWIDGKNS
jgi:rhamnogalacturonyl hydrolase YesR